MSNARKTPDDCLEEFEKRRVVRLQMIAATAELVRNAAPVIGPDRTMEAIGRVLAALNEVMEARYPSALPGAGPSPFRGKGVS